MKTVRISLSFIAVLTLAQPAPIRAAQVDEAYQNFMAGQYLQVFQSLVDYRKDHEGTLRVDFMLAVSACRLPDDDFRAFGGYLLALIPQWYGPLRADHARDVHTQAQACPSVGITEEQALARLQGKSDGLRTERLAPRRSKSGQDQALPRASVPTPATTTRMGPLISGRGYLQARHAVSTYLGATLASAAECSALCAREARCVAMNFVISQKLCQLNDVVPPITTENSDVISAVKLRK